MEGTVFPRRSDMQGRCFLTSVGQFLPGEPVSLAAPHFQEYATLLGDVLACTGWPSVAARRPPPLPLASIGGPVALVIGTTFDNDTPYVWSQRLAGQLGGRLLTRDGLGHVSTGRGLACIDGAVASYLRDLSLPKAGAAC